MRRPWLVTCLVAMLLIATGCGPSVVELDNEQGHLDQAAPLPGGQHTIGQTFVSHYPRLTAVEVLLVVYDEPQPAPSRQLTFHLRTGPYSQQDLVTLRVDTASLKHNDPYRFTFPPQPDSEGREYFFLLEASEGNKVSVWQSSRNAYGEGTLIVDGQPAHGDLLFKTYYDFDVGASLVYLGRGVVAHLGMVLALLALLLAPGYLLYSLLLPDAEIEPLEHLAVVVGLSLAVIPLVMLVATTLGLRLTAFWVRAAVVLAVALSLWQLRSYGLADRQRHRAERVSKGSRLSVAAMAAFGVVFIIALALRFLHSRTLVLPAWVDSVHHTMTVELIMQAGGVPDSFRPFMPIDHFFLHFGFHAIAAVVAWLTGLDAPTAVLTIGQVLNALMALSMALLTSYLTRRVWAGVVAALIVGTVSLMPAFYLSWGRYTQLTGLVLLPTAVALALDALRSVPDQGGEDAPPVLRRVLLASVAAAGLFLTHYRVALFFGAFVIAHLLVASWANRRSPERVRAAWAQGAGVVLLAAVFVLPWLINVASIWVSRAVLGGQWQGTPGYNAVPRELLWVGKNRGLAVLAGMGLLWGLLRREHGVITLCIVCALLVVMANPSIFGLPTPWLFNNAALVIAFFVPLSFGVGCLGGWGMDRVRSWLPERWHGAYGWTAAAAVTAIALWGAADMLTVVNPVTILATRDDLAAIAWIGENIPPDAKFLVNARPWQEGVYMGTDGGYWIPLLTGRATTLPPALYFYGAPEYLAHVTAVAEATATVSSADDAALRRVIEGEGVTHVYIGARGGALQPEFFLDDPHYRTLYSTGSVWIFAVTSNQ